MHVFVEQHGLGFQLQPAETVLVAAVIGHVLAARHEGVGTRSSRNEEPANAAARLACQDGHVARLAEAEDYDLGRGRQAAVVRSDAADDAQDLVQPFQVLGEFFRARLGIARIDLEVIGFGKEPVGGMGRHGNESCECSKNFGEKTHVQTPTLCGSANALAMQSPRIPEVDANPENGPNQTKE